MGQETLPILAGVEPRSCWGRFRAAVTVEPVTFLYILGYILSTTLIQQYASYYLAMQLNGDPELLTEGLCYVPTNSSAFVTQVEEQTGSFLSAFSLLNFLPMVVASVLMGAYSDNRGRKSIMVLPVLGGILRGVISLAFVYTEVSISYFYIPAALEGLFGGTAVFETAVFAYVADVSTRNRRSWRMVVLLIAQALGVAVAEVTSGYLITYFGFIPPLYMVLTAYVLCLIVIATYIRESVTSSAKDAVFRCANLLQPFRLLWGTGDPGRTWVLRMSSLVAFLSYITQGIMSYAVYLYVAQYPLCFNWIEVGFLIGTAMVMTAISGIVTFALFHKCLRDTGLMILAACDAVLGELYYTIPVMSTVYVFLQPLVGFMSALVTPLSRAMMSNSVDPSQQGTVQSIAAVSNVLGTMIGSAGASALYAATASYYTGSAFVFAAAMFFIITLCAIAIRYRIQTTALKDVYNSHSK